MSQTLDRMFDLTGRTAVITGGAGMLGRQYGRTLLEAGANVVLADLEASRPAVAVGEIAQTLGGTAPARSLGIGFNVADQRDVERMVRETVARFGSLDILINNAAIDPKIDKEVVAKQAITFEDYPLDLWQKSVDVNLTGVFLCCQSAGKQMLQQERGVIVNICSTYGVVAPDQRLYQRDGEAEQQIFKPAAYAVTKAGVAHLTKYLATYWAGRNIRVNTLTPHGVQNNQDDQFLKRYAYRCPLGRMARQDEMNGAMLFLVSDASSYMTGGNLVVDGGWTAW
jgi:NAD(P)-dependent dehydrogenase (short-subunit alcohol dehydrogenase family)